jgi:hypothetical protein
LYFINRICPKASLSSMQISESTALVVVLCTSKVMLMKQFS